MPDLDACCARSRSCGQAVAASGLRGPPGREAVALRRAAPVVFDKAIMQFAAGYADQNERGCKSLVDAVASGRITAEPDRWDPAAALMDERCGHMPPK
jgi:hypothetical protein